MRFLMYQHPLHAGREKQRAGWRPSEVTYTCLLKGGFALACAAPRPARLAPSPAWGWLASSGSMLLSSTLRLSFFFLWAFCFLGCAAWLPGLGLGGLLCPTKAGTRATK